MRRLRTALHRALGHGDPGLVIATTARGLTDHHDPTGMVWAMLTAASSDTVTERLRLTDLSTTRPARTRLRVVHPQRQASPTAKPPSTASTRKP